MTNLTKIQPSRLNNEEITSYVLNNKITNCITEIPQDIKLELKTKYAWFNGGFLIYLYTDSASVSVNDKVYGDNINVVVGTITQVSGNTITIYFPEEYDAIPAGVEVDFTRDSSGDVAGILTLKSGSKVTYLDGTTQTISSDVSTTGVSFAGECFVFYKNGVLDVRAISQVSSGTSTPTSAVSGKNLYFNTSTKKVYSYTNNQWGQIAFSLPLGTITLQASSPYIKSFDKTFNGFGYFGSTVYALPGVKGLIPNGRNEDGTLRNTEIVNNSVKTTTTNYTISDGLVALTAGGIYEISTTTWNYNKEKNIYENSSGEKSNHIVLASASYTNGVISNFQPKTTFHAVDYNDFMNRKLLVPNYNSAITVSGTSYTVPSDGFIIVKMPAVNGTVVFTIGSVSFVWGATSNNYKEASSAVIPVSAGTVLSSMTITNGTVVFCPVK